MDSSTASLCWRSAPMLFVCVVGTYFAGYGLLRWRQVLVYREYCSFIRQDVFITADRMPSKRPLAAVNNVITDSSDWFYMPLRKTEAALWMWRLNGRWSW